MKKQKTRKTRGFLLLFLMLFLAGSGIWMGGSLQNPRVRMLLSVVHFAEQTLESPAYLAYDIDICDLIHQYINGEIKISGKAGLLHVPDFDVSMSATLEAVRSFPQKRFAVTALFNVLWLEAGEVEVYAEDETIYLLVPMLDNLEKAFPTGINLFMKLPDLTSDLNHEWFRDSASDILELMQEIQIEETGNRLVDEDGTESEEFVITIPEGSGQFIWKLLGMEAPDYDVTVSVYLTKGNCLRRMTVDLSHVLEGAVFMVDGKEVGKAIFTYALPDEESVEITFLRNPAYRRWMDIEASYYANTGEVYGVSAALKWEETEPGFSVHVNDILFTCDGKSLGEAYFVGEVVPIEETEDVFGGKASYLYGLEKTDWRSIRADASEKIEEMLEKITGKFLRK